MISRSPIISIFSPKSSLLLCRARLMPQCPLSLRVPDPGPGQLSCRACSNVGPSGPARPGRHSPVAGPVAAGRRADPGLGCCCDGPALLHRRDGRAGPAAVLARGLLRLLWACCRSGPAVQVQVQRPRYGHGVLRPSKQPAARPVVSAHGHRAGTQSLTDQPAPAAG